MSPYPIAWSSSGKRALERLPEMVSTAAIEFIYGPLADNPKRVGKPLRFELEGLHSARRGDDRVIYEITGSVRIVDIQHRADVYR